MWSPTGRLTYVPNYEPDRRYDVVQWECDGLVRLVTEFTDDGVDGSGDAIEEAGCGSGEFRRRTPQGVQHEPSSRLRMIPVREFVKPKPSVKNAVTDVPTKMTGVRPQLSVHGVSLELHGKALGHTRDSSPDEHADELRHREGAVL